MPKKVTIWCDGACSGNPGPGGCAAILDFNGVRKEIVEGFPATTNNIMELTGAILALQALKEPCEVELNSDSQYLIKGLNEWLDGWKAKGWRKADRSPVQNDVLWMELDRLRNIHKITAIWTKGKTTPEGNRVDILAYDKAQSLKGR